MRFILDALGLGGNGGGFDKIYIRDLDRASYKSPSGAVIPFDFEDVESTIQTKAAAFESASGNGTYVQHNGHTSGRFPMACFFHGDGYEEKASAFVGALLEPGVGQLTHPSFGVPINVVPMGEIRHAEPLKSAGGQAIIAVTFWETTGLLIGEEESLDQLYDSFADAASVDFSEKIQLDTATDRAGFMNKITSVLGKISSALSAATKVVSNATSSIEDVGDSIDRGMDILVGQPLALARQVQIMVSEPRRQIEGIQAKWDGYKNLADDIFGGDTPSPSKYSPEDINGFHMDKLVAGSVVANGAAMLAAGEYATKADYIRAADELKDLSDEYQAWSDTGYTALAESTLVKEALDTGGGRLELQAAVSSSLSALIENSFNAKTEMRKTLESDRTPIDLCYELYGSAAFEHLDLFTYSNHLIGDENVFIPKGREIVWYL